VAAGADAIVVTGAWTADAPELLDLEKVRRAIGAFPIIVGSGATVDNIAQLKVYADGVIVSTSLKQGEPDIGEVNVKPASARIDVSKVTNFVRQFRAATPDDTYQKFRRL